MRRAALSLNSSSMQSFAAALVRGAGSGQPAASSFTTQACDSSCTVRSGRRSGTLPALQGRDHQQQRQPPRTLSSPLQRGARFAWPNIDPARQQGVLSRTVAAAAAAQPALAAEEVDGSCEPMQQSLRAHQQHLLGQQQQVAVAPPQNAAASGGCARHNAWQVARVAGPAVGQAQQEPCPAASAEAIQLPVPNLGYTCQNLELQQRFGYRSNRFCRRRTFEAEGLPLISRLSLANCRDLLPLVEWNRRHGIHFFRIPSSLFPWSHEYELEELPDYEEIAATLAQVGAAARAANQRLTAHPSHFVQLASPDPALLARSLRELELNARVFDFMGYQPSHTNKINIHVGALHGSKRRSLDRFAASLDQLSYSCRARLTVENDDRCTMFTIADLLPLHAMAGTPLVFDYLHHALVPGGLSEEEALLAALSTWPAGIRPVVHYSEPSENPALPRRAHSRMLTQPFSLYGHEADVDVMLEAKGMEQALVFYRDALQLGRKQETRVPPARGAVIKRWT